MKTSQSAVWDVEPDEVDNLIVSTSGGDAMSLKPVCSSASERNGYIWNLLEDVYPKAKARIWA